MRPRVPLTYAGLLVIALLAVVGFAAFSPTQSLPTDESAGSTSLVVSPVASARVASAVLALRVANPETRVATTQAATSTTESDTPTEDSTTTTQPATTPTTSSPTTTETSDSTPPPLKLTSHDDGETVTSSYVVFEGTSEPGAYVRSGPFDADVDADGNWSLGLTMVDGANRAIFTAIDKAGNSVEVRITVHYDEPKPTTTTTDAHAHTHTTTTTDTHTHTTTTSPPAKTTTWSPLWPADGGGIRNVEAWRPLVAKYWASDRVDCVLSIIKKESRSDPRAYNSGSGAEGLMQHLGKYWKNRAAAAGFKDSNGLYASPYNAEANIAAGAYIAGSGSNWYAPWNWYPAYGSCAASGG